MNAEIEKLLNAQKIDNQRLQKEREIEMIKHKTLKAAKDFNEARVQLDQLETDAQNLQKDYQTAAKNVEEILTELEKAQKDQCEDASFFESLKTDLNYYSSRLSGIAEKILEKCKIYKTKLPEAEKSRNDCNQLKQAYAEKKKTVDPETQSLEKQFNEAVQGINDELIKTYRTVRKSKGNDGKNVVVPLIAGNQCEGCCKDGHFMDVSVATINKIKTNGWAVCEECGRILYQA